MTEILISVGIFAALGIAFGVLLSLASKIFAVKSDERIAKIVEYLPGANCGGCGYSGCSGLAEAIVKGDAAPNRCRSCSADALAKVCEMMGLEAQKPEPVHAHVMCSGGCKSAVFKYRYEGASDCIAAEKMGGGDKLCPNGCIGLGTCVSVCKYDAIHVVDGLAVVDPDKCIGCGACSNICPKHLIRMIPVSSKFTVQCRSVENGAITRKQCTAGCISCHICEKNCPVGAITVTDFVASIDQNKCIGCGLCAEKCPRKIIRRDN